METSWIIIRWMSLLVAYKVGRHFNIIMNAFIAFSYVLIIGGLLLVILSAL